MTPPLRATIALLEKVTLTPGQVETADVDAVRAAGVSDQAISDALHVSFCFNLIDRLADSFGWHVQTEKQFGQDAKFLLSKGYGLVGPVSRKALATP